MQEPAGGGQAPACSSAQAWLLHPWRLPPKLLSFLHPGCRSWRGPGCRSSLFEGFSPWQLVKTPNAIRRPPPVRGVYEWGVQPPRRAAAPSSSGIIAFYLGRAGAAGAQHSSASSVGCAQPPRGAAYIGVATGWLLIPRRRGRSACVAGLPRTGRLQCCLRPPSEICPYRP
jgi:hypothetical protein